MQIKARIAAYFYFPLVSIPLCNLVSILELIIGAHWLLRPREMMALVEGQYHCLFLRDVLLMMVHANVYFVLLLSLSKHFLQIMGGIQQSRPTEINRLNLVKFIHFSGSTLSRPSVKFHPLKQNGTCKIYLHRS